MMSKAKELYGKPVFKEMLKNLDNKKLSELDSLDAKAIWTRVYDETYRFKIASSELLVFYVCLYVCVMCRCIAYSPSRIRVHRCVVCRCVVVSVTCAPFFCLGLSGLSG